MSELDALIVIRCAINHAIQYYEMLLSERLFMKTKEESLKYQKESGYLSLTKARTEISKRIFEIENEGE